MSKKVVTKEMILAEFQKSDDFDAPQTMEDLNEFIRDAVTKQEFTGKSIVFVFDRGHWADDMPRYIHLEYQLTKEDLSEYLPKR